MKAFSFVLLFLTGAICTAQTDDDNIPVLKGTTVLTASENNMHSRWIHGLWLGKIQKSDCTPSKSEVPGLTTINSLNFYGDTLLVADLNVNSNCCFEFLGEIQVINDTLNLIYHGYGGACICNCCFGLTYEISLYKDEVQKFQKIRYVTINGNKKLTREITWPK